VGREGSDQEATAMTTIGPAGDYPEGKLGKDDDGGLNIAIGVNQHNLVHIAFGSKVAWIAMPAKQAFEFARIIRQNARKAEIVMQRRARQ